MKYNKLIRDKIPGKIKKSGSTLKTHIANDKEYGKALNEKLKEEVDEFLENPCVEEATDILEVIKAICEMKNIDISNLEEIRQDKAKKRGGFKKRIILDSTDE